MALKDWKKRYTVYGSRWDNNKTQGMVYINEKRYDRKLPYKVEIYKEYFGGASEKPSGTKSFKTKLQALKFAKNYMRKH